MPIRGAKVQIFLLSTHIFLLKLLLFNEIYITEPQKYLISRYKGLLLKPDGKGIRRKAIQTKLSARQRKSPKNENKEGNFHEEYFI